MATNNNIFAIKHNDLLPRKGGFLISEPFLQDAYFQRSVVFLLQHSRKGSMGVVLNKKTTYHVNEFFPDLEHLPLMPLYLGGPISSNKLFFIHTLGNMIPGTIEIEEGIYFDGDFDAIRQYACEGNPVEGKIKFFLGYSGWTEGQLEKEIKQNSWVVSHQSFKDMMIADGEDFWKHSLEALGSKYKTWTKFPKNPELN